MPVYFDASLPIFSALVEQEWGRSALDGNLFLRDVSGRLTFVVLDDFYTKDQRAELASKAEKVVASYVDKNGFAVATPDELFDDRLKSLKDARKISLDGNDFNGQVNLVDRRMIGADWLREPKPSAGIPTRLIFASLKGGVGRSTALCVLAAHLASKGSRVLAIDMDLEAPGLGNLLLPDGTLPKFGLLDYLVENGLGEIDDAFYADMIGYSWLGGGQGRVAVIPAIGESTLRNPANALAKLARAYLASEDTSNNMGLLTFTDHMSALIERLADPLRYDVILVDARAGLHETAATAIVGLGGEVLFFGIDQAQTFAGYELLLAHLATLPVDPKDDWRNRIRFIQAKAPINLGPRKKFAERINSILEGKLWPSPPENNDNSNIEGLKNTFEVEWVDEAVDIDFSLEESNEIPVLAIGSDDRFSAFDPITDRDVLEESAYQATYGSFIDEISQILKAAQQENHNEK